LQLLRSVDITLSRHFNGGRGLVASPCS
jgi:hypothetical protein